MSAVIQAIRGVNPEAVIELLKERVQALRAGQFQLDGRKLALIVEGGAMRGVVSCGALMALEELGLTETFEEVYGASAGAINAAYFLAGQAAYATTIYYQDINTSRFIRPPWRRRLVDLDYLFDTVIARERRLRVEKVLDSRSQFYISIADAKTGEGFLANAQESQEPLLTLLKASGAMPLLYNGLVVVQGRECFDGGLINPLPIYQAVENGCTDLLVLLTRPESFRMESPSAFERRLFESNCARGNDLLMQRFIQGYTHSNELRDVAFGRTPTPSSVNIATICPEEDEPPVERMSRDRQLLKNAAIASARRTLIAFGRIAEEFAEVLRPYPPIEPL